MAEKVLPAEFDDPAVKSIGWTDIHTHLNFLEISPEEAVKVATEKGVNRFITIDTEPDDLPVVLELAESLPPRFFALLGFTRMRVRFTPTR